jgi:DNA ligase-1
LVIVGAFYGKGKRAGTYGTFLLAAYNPDEDIFKTVTKVGTGFTDADLEKLPTLLNTHKISHKHPRVDSTIDVDIWFEPSVVIEIRGAELTLSPVHTCAMNAIREGSGIAIRFPRFTGKYRIDKSAEDSTTTQELVEMYKSQLKRIGV